MALPPRLKSPTPHATIGPSRTCSSTSLTSGAFPILAQQTPASELYTAYKGWCEAGGEPPLCKRDFGLALQERGFQKARSGSQQEVGWGQAFICG